MKKRTRYLLLVFGFILFLIIAPIIVLYVGGFSYDSLNNRYVRTGILVVNTNPEDAEVFLDGELKDTSPSRLKFLKPGSYSITVKKDGYHTWSKKLEIQSNKVTWAAVGIDHVYLLKDNPEIKTIAGEVKDFVIANDSLIYLTSGGIVTSPIGNPTQTKNLSSGFNFTDTASITLNPNKNLAIIKNNDKTIIFDVEKQTFTDISSLVHQSILHFSDNNTLYSLDNGILYTVDWKKQIKTNIAENILSATTKDDSLYLLRKLSSNSELINIPRGGNIINDAQILLSNLPIFTKSELLVTRSKEIFLLADNSVYKVNDKLHKLTDNVIAWQHNDIDSSLLFIGNSELNYFDFNSGNTNLITRTSNKISGPTLARDLGYLFYGQEGALRALEFDSRDYQNNFVLTNNTESIRKIIGIDEYRTIYILDEQTIKSLQIRK